VHKIDPNPRSVDVPLPTHRLAKTALQALQVDKELSPLVRRELSVAEDDAQRPPVLHVEYRATTNRMLRVAVNGFMDSLKLVVEVMETLDADVLEPCSNRKSPS
jgi:EKC/KEOPS complex subunit PCC1/LAGE3